MLLSTVLRLLSRAWEAFKDASVIWYCDACGEPDHHKRAPQPYGDVCVKCAESVSRSHWLDHGFRRAI